MKVKLASGEFEIVNCTSWRIAVVAPACAIGHNVAACETCAHQTARPAPPPVPALAKRVAQYVRAEASRLISEPLDVETITKRLEICNACEHLNRAPAAPLGFCRACGCGQHAAAELTHKATMPAASCPTARWNDPTAARAPLAPVPAPA